MSTTVWGRIVHRMWAKRPGGESSRGRIVQGAKRPGAKRPGGETSRVRIVLVANRSGGETSTIGGETSKWRNVHKSFKYLSQTT